MPSYLRQLLLRLFANRFVRCFQGYFFICHFPHMNFGRRRQIAARTTPSGALEVELTPRSGRFTILFGRLDDIGGKFDKLLRFYRSGLSSIGWDEYRTIDVRYRNQVVCKK